MRSSKFALALPLLAATLALGACAAPTEGDDATGDTSQDVTGGSNAIESPVVFLFDKTAPSTAAPLCAGALISDTMVVTAKACVKDGATLVVGRAADKDGRGTHANVKAAHPSEDKNAEVIVLEIDKSMKGMHAVITHTPLRDGYTVNAFAATDGQHFWSPDKGEASSVDGSLTEETDTVASISPAKGQEICDGDMGAPVCSSVGGHLAGYDLPGGTCGLGGLITARVDPTSTGTTKGCSGSAFKVVKLGQYHDYLAKYAPGAFQPLKIDVALLSWLPAYAPDGLWGYKTKGDITACTLGTTALSALKPGVPTGKLNAKVSFANMDKKAAPYGRFGIALKTDPTNMRWLPAARLDDATGTKFDSSFEGTVNAAKNGDYIIAFRASANGGETWTQCDTDGIANGFSADKAIALTVTDATTTTPTPDSTTPQTTTPPSDPPATSGEEATQDDGSQYPTVNDPSADEPTAKPKTESGGCSQTGSSSPLGSSLPILGAVFGLLALKRKKR